MSSSGRPSKWWAQSVELGGARERKGEMTMKAKLLEQFQVVTVIAPVDLTVGANSGDWVHLGTKFRRCLFLVAKGAGGTSAPRCSSRGTS